MSRLSDFLKSKAPAAIPAISAIPGDPAKKNSNNSENSGRDDYKSHLPDLLEADDDPTPLSPIQMAARHQVLAQLDANPAVRRAFTNRFEHGYMIVTLAVRGIGTCELSIAAERFNPASAADYTALLECMEVTPV